jgi:methyl-accepting chemotaxis protein
MNLQDLLRFRSVRAKFLTLIFVVASLIALGSGWFSTWNNGGMLVGELDKRGEYIAANLAQTAVYGVLTQDRPMLQQLLDAVVEASGDRETTDVVSAIIRDASGQVLAHQGELLTNLPEELPSELETRMLITEAGDEVKLFRAPVSAGEGGLAAAGEGQSGGVEVAISTAVLSRQQRGSYLAAFLIGLALVVGGCALGWFLSGRWLAPVTGIASVATAVADGDLTETITADSDDEIGILARSFNGMVLNLRKVVDNIQDASVQVATSAGQISANAKLITQGAQSQAQAAEETSTSMEEMAASIQTVASNAQGLATYVEETSTSINQMGASIEEVARSSSTLANTVAEATSTIEEMTISMDQMAKDLGNLATTVSETAETVEQMSRSTESVARNAESLSAAVASTTTTVSEMAAGVTEVAKIAEEADRISRQASDDARTGDEAVGRTIEGMKVISENMENTARVITGLGQRSQEIGKILEVIEEIADQTNLLALNAAIEAARAGEAGRGFAVVADEVRKLAERSVEATKEIGEVIRQVQKETTAAVDAARSGAAETKEGIQLADKAGVALRRILESVTRSSQLMARIAESTAMQSKASTDVLQTVENMTEATQQTTSQVGVLANGSEQIREAVDNINRIANQAAYSTKEQAAGGRQVRLAVENMNKIAAQVNIATKEQADGSRQIIQGVEKMNRMTQQVSYATSEQKRGGEVVVRAMENISEIARDNLGTVEEMSKATSNLAQQAENLAKLIAVFRSK